MRLECQLFGLFFCEGEVTKAAFEVADSSRVGACDALIKKHDLESDRLKHFLADGLFDAFQSCQLQGVNPLYRMAAIASMWAYRAWTFSLVITSWWSEIVNSSSLTCNTFTKVR